MRSFNKVFFFVFYFLLLLKKAFVAPVANKTLTNASIILYS